MWQLERMGRLKANNGYYGTLLNLFLMEYVAANNRILSGEVIIFQNDMLDVIQELVNHTEHSVDNSKLMPDRKLKGRYVVGIIMEFMRALVENGIPH